MTIDWWKINGINSQCILHICFCFLFRIANWIFHCFSFFTQIHTNKQIVTEQKWIFHWLDINSDWLNNMRFRWIHTIKWYFRVLFANRCPEWGDTSGIVFPLQISIHKNKFDSGYKWSVLNYARSLVYLFYLWLDK